jgi:predicted MPP superfamily phosphohydrolase
MPLTRRAALKGMLATAVGAVTGAAAYGGAYERHRIGVTEETIRVKGLSPAWDGRRIALLTDIHHSALVPAADVVRAVSLANAQNPDLIVLGGDYVTNADRDFMEPVAELLAPLRAPLGVYAILGNHDDDREMPAALTRHGIEVLRDRSARVSVRREGIELAGIRFWTRGSVRVGEAIEKTRDPIILLAHDPRRLAEASTLGVTAVLSGHTHGGQVVLPGLGAPAARKFPVTEGLARMADTTLFVSRGVGTVYLPVRINCPPEVAVITLRPAA